MLSPSFTTTGGMDQEATRFLKRVAEKLASKTRFFIKSCNIILHYQCNNNWPLVAGITYFYF